MVSDASFKFQQFSCLKLGCFIIKEVEVWLTKGERI
jgi:hypothetical protein